MTTLYLARNEIKAEGARFLADALELNTVRPYFYSLISIALHLYLTQALTTLYLAWNEIGVKGAEYLAKALKRNTVRLFRI